VENKGRIKMRVCTVTWNQNLDETKIKYAKEFTESDWIVRADVLRDMKYMVEEKYIELFAKDAK
jgi:hypothetical protein